MRYAGSWRAGGWGAGWCRPVYRSFHRRWRNWSFYSYWARPCFGGSCVAYWSPGCYDAYCGTWVNGSPAFGFGQVYYGPTYNSYFPADSGYVAGPVEYGAEYPEEYVEYTAEPAPAAGLERVVVEEPLPVEEEVLVEEAQASADAPGLVDFEAGVELFLAGEYGEALTRFETAATLEPDNGEIWMAVAHAGFAAGRYRASARAIAEAAVLGAFPRGYRYDPLPMYPQEGRFDELFAQLEKWRETHPEDANAHLVAAYFHVALGHTAETNQAIIGVLTFRPEDPTAPVLNVAMLPPLPPEATPDAQGLAPEAQGGSALSSAAAPAR